MKEDLNRIKEILVRKNVSQKKLSEHLQRNVHTVSSWCTNRAQPHLKELYKIAEYLKVDVCELLKKQD
jgi:transcriptional regulator with XRE-family HTH domain|tara:strand:- start:887 stop:1090 length:204 start_codon:yes stop_codon:yes gene_type:complete